MGQWTTPVWVIADDFTGANDAGSALAKAGARVHVLFDAQQISGAQQADVQVISTDSRAVAAADAAQRVRDALSGWPRGQTQSWLFKKIDSTLRGNLGAELEAALQASAIPLAIVAPAVPRLGRTTLQGHCYIHGQLLTESEYASDPKTPLRFAGVAERIQEQSALTSQLIALESVRGGTLADRFCQALNEGVAVLVVDAENDSDLQQIVQAARALTVKPLLVGAAGLSDALSQQLSRKPASPVLAVVGSMSLNAQQQITQLQQQREVTLIDVTVEQLFSLPVWPEHARWRDQAIAALQRGQHCVIRTCQSADQRLKIDDLCARHDLSRQQLGEAICALLAELTASICQQVTPGGLYLSGGDVAIAVARGLGASGFQIEGQIAGCVPWGRLLNADVNVRVMTKAGGFGDENTLVEVIRFIEEMSSE